MKKHFFYLLTLMLVISCSKKKESKVTVSAYDYSAKLPYDTTAVDSFSPGATPKNMVLNRVIVDSATLARMEEEKRISKKKKEEEKKKAKEAAQ